MKRIVVSCLCPVCLHRSLIEGCDRRQKRPTRYVDFYGEFTLPTYSRLPITVLVRDVVLWSFHNMAEIIFEFGHNILGAIVPYICLGHSSQNETEKFLIVDFE
jgi:hypothetical protein